MPKAKKSRTPARIMADMIEFAMKIQGETKTSLAKKMHVALNTVCGDMKEPERIPQNRLWLYFTVLDAPMDDVLQAVAYKVADNAIER